MQTYRFFLQLTKDIANYGFRAQNNVMPLPVSYYNNNIFVKLINAIFVHF